MVVNRREYLPGPEFHIVLSNHYDDTLTATPMSSTQRLHDLLVLTNLSHVTTKAYPDPGFCIAIAQANL